LAEGLSRAEDLRIAEIRIGLTYTAVQLSDGSTGLAMTFLDGWKQGRRCLEKSPATRGALVSQVLPALGSRQPVEAALALACANALFNRNGLAGEPGNALDLLGLGRSDRVVMIGHFKPLVERVRKQVQGLDIFDCEADREPGVQAASEALTALPEASVALITATALVNQSLDDLLAHTSNCREVVLMGASTPLCPEVFADSPVSLLAGARVVDPPAVLRSVSEGGGMRALNQHLRKFNIRPGSRGA
jgi:uncharacterized protein (DUF4213/DUF364 family)